MMMTRRRIYIFAISVVVIITALWQTTPPFSFPGGTLVEIPKGAGLYELAEQLENERVIRSPFIFRLAAILMGGERRMQAGEYYMSRPQNVFIIAWRILYGKHGIEVARITIPEGYTAEKIAELFDERFIFFNRNEFKRVAEEGYLFPDTYFIPVTASVRSVVRLLKDNFDKKVKPVFEGVDLGERSFEDVITMASIIEREANTEGHREIISGILWKRIELGIPLQVDATFAYVNGKTTKDLTLDDLKEDSPYNTYTNKGLPPTPIANPGLESIIAALHPTSTPYLYFLTGDDGKMYYSRTHDEHVEKKAKYIN